MVLRFSFFRVAMIMMVVIFSITMALRMFCILMGVTMSIRMSTRETR